MPIQPINIITEEASKEDLINEIAKLQKILRYLLNGGLDTENVNELNANVIIANTITAEKMNVNELSAISANMGEVTAGIITGLLIRTADQGVYPRIELSSTSDILIAEANADESIEIRALSGSSPVLFFDSALGETLLFQDSDIFGISTAQSVSISGNNGVSISSFSQVDVENLTVNGGTEFDTLSQPNSTATTVGDLTNDFNNLLTKLRSLNILA
jgi:hypothetical protein